MKKFLRLASIALALVIMLGLAPPTADAASNILDMDTTVGESAHNIGSVQEGLPATVDFGESPRGTTDQILTYTWAAGKMGSETSMEYMERPKLRD